MLHTPEFLCCIRLIPTRQGTSSNCGDNCGAYGVTHFKGFRHGNAPSLAENGSDRNLRIEGFATFPNCGNATLGLALPPAHRTFVSIKSAATSLRGSLKRPPYAAASSQLSNNNTNRK
jgi:hypothetical protein